MNATCLDKGGTYTASINITIIEMIPAPSTLVCENQTSLLTYQIASYMNFFFFTEV